MITTHGEDSKPRRHAQRSLARQRPSPSVGANFWRMVSMLIDDIFGLVLEQLHDVRALGRMACTCSRANNWLLSSDGSPAWRAAAQSFAHLQQLQHVAPDAMSLSRGGWRVAMRELLAQEASSQCRKLRDQFAATEQQLQRVQLQIARERATLAAQGALGDKLAELQKCSKRRDALIVCIDREAATEAVLHGGWRTPAKFVPEPLKRPTGRKLRIVLRR